MQHKKVPKHPLNWKMRLLKHLGNIFKSGQLNTWLRGTTHIFSHGDLSTNAVTTMEIMTSGSR